GLRSIAPAIRRALCGIILRAGVSVTPGCTMLERIPWGPYSLAILREIDSKHALAALTAAYPHHATSLPSLVKPITRASEAKYPLLKMSRVHVKKLVPMACT